MQNRSDNKSGKVGVHKNKSGKYLAYIKIAKKQKHLGVFENFKDAVLCRLKAEKLYFNIA